MERLAKIERTPENEKIIKALAFMGTNSLINTLANENVVFGRIKAKEKVPTKQYLENLGLKRIIPYIADENLDGVNIQNSCIVEKDFSERCFDLYIEKISYLFYKIPTDKSFEEDNGIAHYKYGWYEYLNNLYPLFVEIIKTEVHPDLFTAIPELLNLKQQVSYYDTVSRFVLAIKTKGLRQGGRIDRYVKNMNFISPIIKRLIITRKGHYYLKNSNINSLDYKLALFSCFRFMNEDNAKLFELKMLQWEEQHNAE